MRTQNPSGPSTDTLDVSNEKRTVPSSTGLSNQPQVERRVEPENRSRDEMFSNEGPDVGPGRGAFQVLRSDPVDCLSFARAPRPGLHERVNEHRTALVHDGDLENFVPRPQTRRFRVEDTPWCLEAGSKSLSRDFAGHSGIQRVIARAGPARHGRPLRPVRRPGSRTASPRFQIQLSRSRDRKRSPASRGPPDHSRTRTASPRTLRGDP